VNPVRDYNHIQASVLLVKYAESRQEVHLTYVGNFVQVFGAFIVGLHNVARIEKVFIRNSTNRIQLPSLNTVSCTDYILLIKELTTAVDEGIPYF
jgi:hypothetical protein